MFTKINKNVIVEGFNEDIFRDIIIIIINYFIKDFEFVNFNKNDLIIKRLINENSVIIIIKC